ncbi:MAG: porin, partial [Deltaproteobacteria bacterium]|nr:porin [Deltaproteobacteria bacterium]
MKKILKAIALLPPVTALAFCMFLGAALALELDFHGLFQLQYENSDGNTNDEKVNEMFIRRMTLRFTGNISKKAKLILEPEFGKGEPEIKDAYLLFSNPSNEVRIGNHLVPFESEQIVADKSLAFVERRLTASLSPGHNEGVSLLYHFFKKKLYIQAGVWNTNFNVDAETSLINNRLDHPQVFFSNYEERGNNLFINAARLEFGTSSYSRYEGFRHDPKRKSFTQYGASFFKTSASPSEDGPIQGATGFRNASAYEVDFAYNGSSLNFELVYGSRHLEWWQYSFVQLEQVSITSIQKSYSAHLLFAFSPR